METQALLNKNWCTCPDPLASDTGESGASYDKEQTNSIDFKEDGECKCGIVKHHYHHIKCGGIIQIG